MPVLSWRRASNHPLFLLAGLGLPEAPAPLGKPRTWAILPAAQAATRQPEPADVRQYRGASPQRNCCLSPRVHVKGRQVEESTEECCGFLHWDDSKGVFLPAGGGLYCGGAGMKHKEEGMTYRPCLPWNDLVQVPRKPGATTGLCCSRPPSPSLISVCSRTTGGRAQALALPRSLTWPLTSHRAL